MKKIIIFLIISFVVISLGSSAQIKILGNGDVGMGLNIPTPAYKLDIVSGESRFSTLRITHWGMDPRISSNSNIVFYKLDGTGYANLQCQVKTEYSDSTAKENITDLSGKNLEKVKKLAGVSFNWKNDKNKALQSGFLAQEVEKVIPEAVYTNEDTKQKSIAYSLILPYLVEATKELQLQIETLKGDAEVLEANINKKNKVLKTADDIIGNQVQFNETPTYQLSNVAKISCFIPDWAESSVIYLYNSSGTQLEQYNVKGKGKQFINIGNESLIPGKYFCTLIVNGKEVSMKKMILTD